MPPDAEGIGRFLRPETRSASQGARPSDAAAEPTYALSIGQQQERACRGRKGGKSRADDKGDKGKAPTRPPAGRPVFADEVRRMRPPDKGESDLRDLCRVQCD
ncbi:hypothetical protein WN72_05610 [Bradyrhizobium arachidis]|jgi:hypothetical protein|uniref:Uncharacterized protein n=1 Tax=Bradyrhizobium arachidis TaxID=858423 RepID=A0AAE7NM82_9BRAD|nr:hypothetical protein WN72_05610 [Bradyrhizobium arachidis]